jgi:chromosome segregation ATPase
VVNASRGNGATTFRDADNATAPSAEQISRANTTEEIRNNLQGNSREIQRGLLRDADTQTRANTRQAANTAQRTNENRRESQVQSNTAETRELRTQERRLERELAQTESEIRQRQTDSARVQSGAGGNPAAAAAALGARVNILAA